MKYEYGEFTPEQLSDQKKDLHSKLFWLLLYRDPKTCDEYCGIDVDKYLNGLMYRIGGLNDLLGNPSGLVTLMSVLQAVKTENNKDNFDYSVYRKLVLDAHSVVDSLF